MKKNIFISIVIIVLIVASGFMALMFGLDFSKYSQANLSKTDISRNQTLEKIFLEINYGDSYIQAFSEEFSTGATALSLLQDAIEKLESEIRTKTYGSTGALVEMIGDKENGQDGKYWLYYVNSELPMVAADKMQLKAGDKVEFKFEKSPF